jgi:hypothetical protein
MEISAALPSGRSHRQDDQASTLDESGGKTVEAVLESWRIDDEWWRDPIARRYVEVVLEGGAHVVLYQDLTTRAWFMQAA